MIKNITILYISLKRFLNEGYTYHASALAFTTLLAIVPLLTILIFIISIFPFFTDLINLTQEYIFAHFLPTSSETIHNYLQNFAEKAHHLPTISFLFLFFSAGMLIITIVNTLENIWEPSTRKLSIRYKFFFWLFIILVPIVLSTGIVLSSYLFSLSWFTQTANQLGIEIYLLFLIPFFLNTGIFTLLYIVVSHQQANWEDGLLGGFIAAILFEIAKKIFAIYIELSPSYELIYGVLATIPIFLLWLYISWGIVLLGALVTHTCYQNRFLIRR